MFSIRELKIDDNDESGVQAISFVDFPAIETDFEYFAKQSRTIRSVKDINKDDLDRRYKWVLNHEGELANEVCPACVHWSNEQPKTLRTWITTALPRVPVGTVVLDMVATGVHEPYNTFCEMDCKCHLELVNEMEQHFVKMEMISEMKREVQGVVLKSNQMIYRNDVDGSGNPGYVYFSKDTVKRLKEKYGWNRSISFLHRDNVTGQAILMDSWLQDKDNETQWFIKYKIIGDKLWQQILSKNVKGFSLEGLFSI